MFAHLSHRGPHPPTAARQAVISLRRLAAALAAVISAGLASMAVATAAWAQVPPDESDQLTPGGVVTAGGMPGWQITLIALGAALVAVVATVLLDRARAAHRAATARTA